MCGFSFGDDFVWLFETAKEPFRRFAQFVFQNAFAPPGKNLALLREFKSVPAIIVAVP